jgi:ATP-binding cassette subfamily F protein 3
MLTIDRLTYRIAGRTLLEGATARLPAGARIGLVGRNGSGKSTLLGLIAGNLAPDDGDIRIRNHARIGTVAQETPTGKQSPLEIVLAASIERAALLAEAETAFDPHRVAEIHERLADIDAHRAEARAATILAGLGFDEVAQARAIEEFSGGWRMRVALAAVLFAEPDLLLLDEPTNHLDLEAAMWLEGFLAG